MNASTMGTAPAIPDQGTPKHATLSIPQPLCQEVMRAIEASGFHALPSSA